MSTYWAVDGASSEILDWSPANAKAILDRYRSLPSFLELRDTRLVVRILYHWIPPLTTSYFILGDNFAASNGISDELWGEGWDKEAMFGLASLYLPYIPAGITLLSALPEKAFHFYYERVVSLEPEFKDVPASLKHGESLWANLQSLIAFYKKAVEDRCSVMIFHPHQKHIPPPFEKCSLLATE